MFMSLFKSKIVCIFAVSLIVPMRDPLKLVDVIVILLAVFTLWGLILRFGIGHGSKSVC